VRLVLCCVIFAAPWAWAANDAADRAAVDKVIFDLKDALRTRDQKAVGKLLAKDTDRAQLTQELLNLSPATRDSSKEVWSELSRPVMIINAVRFPERDVAEVDTMTAQFCPTATRNSAVVLLLKHEKAGWKIASIRAGPLPR